MYDWTKRGNRLTLWTSACCKHMLGISETRTKDKNHNKTCCVTTNLKTYGKKPETWHAIFQSHTNTYLATSAWLCCTFWPNPFKAHYTLFYNKTFLLEPSVSWRDAPEHLINEEDARGNVPNRESMWYKISLTAGIAIPTGFHVRRVTQLFLGNN